jgi:malate dehydrogenase (oxaloacetate-decarboxylating)
VAQLDSERMVRDHEAVGSSPTTPTIVFKIKMKEKKTNKIYKKSLKLHKFYKGKIATLPKCPIRNLSDFNYWYTPGVAAVSQEIYKDKQKVFEYTNRWNTIAIVSDGSRVLGLGDIGPEAALPVMEGKALIFKYLGGVDAIPIVLNVKDADKIIEVVKTIAPSFGGVNLEDIEQPKCFYILERLRKELDIPVWHDDQQGTATVTLAGLINALKIVDKKLNEIKVALIGAGAANVCIARLLIKAGVNAENIVVVDSKGILHPDREDIKQNAELYKEKWELCLKTNKEKIKGGIEEALVGRDVVISASRPGPGVIKKEWIKKMNSKPIVFAEANPVPEILPEEAKQAGAVVVATGRSDYPNQVNNSLCFPGIFRGVLDVQAKTITDEMCIKVAETIAKFAEKKGINENYIIPTMEEWELYPEIAASAAVVAIKQGLARKKLSYKQLYNNAKAIIKTTIEETKLLIHKRFIKLPKFILLFFALFNYLFSSETTISRYKYFAECVRVEGSCGKFYSINTYVISQNKVLLGIYRFDVSITYGATTNSEVGIKFNLNEQQNVMEFEKNITKISPYVKYKIISSKEQPMDFAVGFYKTTPFVSIEKILPQVFSTSILVNLFFSFIQQEKIKYSVAISKYTKWVEYMIDVNPIEELYALGVRILLMPDVKLGLFISDMKNLNNILFYNFIFGISIKV